MQLINAHPRYIPLPLVPLVPDSGDDLGAELDVLEAIGADQLSTEIDLYTTAAGLAVPPRGLLNLRDGGRAAARDLAAAMRALFNACMADDWNTLRGALRRDIAWRTEQASCLGLAAAAGALHAGISWKSAEGALAIPMNRLAADARVSLGGHGLVLMPSVFGLDQILPILPTGRQPTLIYPARRVTPLARGDGDGLAALIGRGRAKALRAVRTGCTTGELASRLGVSAPTASEHATSLRNAALIVSVRQGQRVRHTLTELGDNLIMANSTMSMGN
ncbi:winged helix-turn-helix domain-containing protein [Streptomyces sp. H10-C2]|uniref:ArsR/SmtB family transcription factor n=1 Tax=unclassified Streptomyces TaxID=2593676 RepID=UPI0024B9016A|nr:MULTISPECIES: winged helix-turn-helix domain-containing protein [unclassified Streptomyces]MDJ0343948.1 winged helix-turn-helix domain-containing protein [Streptomyces sp. PH10-H1]MDJ0373389.1 winged helix-turn-helix domain-containing protein [Streptomyces sp. H10-C2]